MNSRVNPGKPAMPMSWEEYAALVAAALGKLWTHEITPSVCYDLLPPKPSFVSEEVDGFIRNMVWEIGGFRSEIRGLLDLLESGASQERIAEFIEWVG